MSSRQWVSFTALHCQGYLVLQKWRSSEAWLETYKTFIVICLPSLCAATTALDYHIISFRHVKWPALPCVRFRQLPPLGRLWEHCFNKMNGKSYYNTVHTVSKHFICCIQNVAVHCFAFRGLRVHTEARRLVVLFFYFFLSVPLRRCQANISNYPRPLFPHYFNS